MAPYSHRYTMVTLVSLELGLHIRPGVGGPLAELAELPLKCSEFKVSLPLQGPKAGKLPPVYRVARGGKIFKKMSLQQEQSE